MSDRLQPTRPDDRGAAANWRDELPAWLQYLIAAYPYARNATLTYAVLEDQFGKEEPEVMDKAVRAYVARHRFWPAVSELRPYVAWADGGIARKWTPAERRRWHRARMARMRAWQRSLPVCPRCGERTPSLRACPFCADMAAMAQEALLSAARLPRPKPPAAGILSRRARRRTPVRRDRPVTSQG